MVNSWVLWVQYPRQRNVSMNISKGIQRSNVMVRVERTTRLRQTLKKYLINVDIKANDGDDWSVD